MRKRRRRRRETSSEARSVVAVDVEASAHSARMTPTCNLSFRFTIRKTWISLSNVGQDKQMIQQEYYDRISRRFHLHLAK